MSVKDYRRRIEREVEEARVRADRPVLGGGAESAGEAESLESIPADGGLRHADDVERVRHLVHDKTAEPGLRAAALAAVMRADPDPATAHEHALARLTDDEETAEMKRVALQLLKQATFHSPSAPDWRPAFLDAARSLVDADDPELRSAVFEVLVAEKDPFAQQKLVDGLRDPEKALVPVEEALVLLSHDVHAEAQEVAAAIADDPPSERARLEALHILAADPAAADRFAGLFADSAEDPKVRELAATALSSLAPERFRSAAREIVEAPEMESAGGGDDQRLRLHTEGLLRLDQ